MKKIRITYMLLFVCLFCISGCGKRKNDILLNENYEEVIQLNKEDSYEENS